jgi:SOS-response transcriptional repressor LexA
MKPGLTVRQRQTLDWMKARAAEGLPSPTIREIAEAITGGNRNGAHQLVLGLAERGYILRLPFRARSLQIIDDSDSAERLRANLLRRLENIGPSLLTPDYLRAMIREMPA